MTNSDDNPGPSDSETAAAGSPGSPPSLATTDGSPLNSALQACELLNRANMRSAAAINGGLHTLHGLSFTDFLLMQVLADPQSGSLRRIDLAAKMGLTASGVTRAMMPLEKTGIVERVADPRDARSSRANLTDAGTELVANAQATASQTAEAFLSSKLSITEVDQLAMLLSKLATD